MGQITSSTFKVQEKLIKNGTKFDSKMVRLGT